jgi:S-disulfanyl-L-cysteine oxidoreductase SoxD
MPTRELCIAAFVVVALACATRAQTQNPYGIGRSATPAEIAGWSIDIDRDGNNLPAGSGSVSRGHEVFDQQCAACHGAKGEGGVGDRLVGGQGTLAMPKPVRTVGSYSPRHAAKRAAIPWQRRRLCSLCLHPQFERPASG